jgi:putative transposase
VRFDPERHHRRSIRRKGHDYRQGVYFVTITAAARQPLFGEVRNGVVWLSAAGALIADVWMHLPIHFPSVRLDAFVVMPDHFHGILVLGEVDWWEGITGASRTPFVLTPPMRYPPFWEQMLAAEARARGVPECLLPAPTAIVAPPVGARFPRPEILNPEILNPEISNPETPNHENSPGNPLGSMHGAVGFTHGAVGFTHGAVGFTQGAATAPLPHETRSRLQNPTLGQIIAYFKYQTTKRYNMPQAQPGATLWHTNYYERRLATCDALSAARAYILTNPARAG